MSDIRSKSTWQRRFDMVYMAFFVIHVPVMLVVDLVPYYPDFLRPDFTTNIREFYISTYRDRFFSDPPPWFHTFLMIELFYHLPFSFWAVSALWRDAPTVPLQLLIFAMETAMSTLTCVVEMLNWEGYTRAETNRLCGLYLPYLALAFIMGVDMYIRLRSIIWTKVKVT